MLDKIISVFFEKTQIQKQTKNVDGRFTRLENFASGKTDYITELFANVKGFNVEERQNANQFFI